MGSRDSLAAHILNIISRAHDEYLDAEPQDTDDTRRFAQRVENALAWWK